MSGTLWGMAGLLVLCGGGLSARFTFWRPNIDGVPVLMYHYLTDDLEGTRLPKLRVRPGAFEKQLDYLVRRGYRTIGLKDYHDHLSKGSPLPERPVIVTFDDGEKGSLQWAQKALSQRGFRAVVFVVSDRVGRNNAWDRPKNEPELEMMDWDGLKALQQAGWEIESHTRTHADLTGLDDGALADELAVSKATIEDRLGTPVTGIAYPYGSADERVRRAARKAGYELGLTTRHGKNEPQDDPFALKRLIVKRKDTLWDLALKLKKGRSTL